MELHFTGTGAAYYPRLGSNAAFFVKNKHRCTRGTNEIK